MAEPQRCPNCGREMPAHAAQGLCPACLLGGILDSQDESKPLQGERESTAGTLAEAEATANDRSTGASGTATLVFTELPDPSTDSAPTADFAPDDGPAGDDGSVVPGTRIRYFGDYEIRGELGSGAMGVVYKARQISLNRLVALKMIRAGAFAGEEELRRFQNEAEAVAGLDHHNIVPIYEVGEHDGKRYFSMKLIGGPCLSRTLASYTANPGNAARLMVTIAEAVHHAHQRGILHRDLKPSNILVDEQGEPHVSDFGLAKQVESDGSLTESGAVLGTPAYMAPEQAAGNKRLVTTLSDVYGLGAVLFALLTGKPPFGGDSVMETLDQVRQQQPVPPSRLNPKVPRDLEIICLKCLDKDPQRRYPSAEALGAELRRFLSGEPIQARPVSAFEKGWRWCRRRPVIAGLTAALAVAVLGGLIGTSLGLRAALHARQDALNRERDAREAQAREKEQTELAEQRLYDDRMKILQRYWDNNNRELVQPALVDQLPANQGGKDRRGFEWFYWQRKISSSLLTLKVHTWDVQSVAFSPDGKRLAFASELWTGTVKVSDALTGQEILTLKSNVPPPRSRTELYSGEVTSVAFSPDGKRLASASYDQTVKLWDAGTGQEIRTLKGHTDAVHCVAFSPDGKRLASASADKTVKVWDTGTGEETLILNGHSGTVSSVAFSPDAKRLASASGELNKLESGSAARYNRDLKRFLSASGELKKPGEVKVWDVGTGQETLNLKGHTGYVWSVAFSPDGKRLASASTDETVKVWDTGTGQESLTLRGHTSIVSSVAFSSDGKRLASASWDGTVKVWDAGTGQEIPTLKRRTNSVLCVAFSPDGMRLASASNDGTVRVWADETGPETLTLKGHTGGVMCVAFSPDGKRLASASYHQVKVWNPGTGQEIRTLRGRPWNKPVAFSPDGKRLASASGEFDKPGEVKVWDAGTGQETLTLKGHTSYVWSVGFSPDDKRIASASTDKTVKVWDASTGQEILTLKGHPGAVTCVAFSPDGKRLASGSRSTVTVWDAGTGQGILTLNGLTGSVFGLAFSPDGKRLASLSGDQTVKVWDAGTGQETLTLKGHTGAVMCVAFSPDCKRVASAGYDETVKVWDAGTGQETLTLKGHRGSVWSVMFSPDGKRLASASQDGTVKLWDARPLDAEPANPGPTPR